MNKEIILKRLSLIKLLYRQGIQQSYQSEMLSPFSIFSFHDSIEMFLKLAADEKEINSNGFSFLDYWSKIPELSNKEAARAINTRRVNLKHKGLIPAKVEIEATRVSSTEFFNENCAKLFNLAFSNISLAELVEDPIIKNQLIEAEIHLKTGEFSKIPEITKNAFLQLIDNYKDTKGTVYTRTPLDFFQDIKLVIPHEQPKSNVEKQLLKIFRKINDNFKNFENALTIIALGINYKKFMKFEALTPQGFKTSDDDFVFGKLEISNLTKDKCEFCIEFVTECALKLQEFDYNYENLLS